MRTQAILRSSTLSLSDGACVSLDGSPVRLDNCPFVTEYLLMQPQTFERSLRAFSQRVPFQPFAVELVSGSLVTVDHPEALVFRGGLAVYVAPDGTPSLFDHEGVSHFSGSQSTQAP